MARKVSSDSYTVNTVVSIPCKLVIHRELNTRRLNGETELRAKDVQAEWLEAMAIQRTAELDKAQEG